MNKKVGGMPSLFMRKRNEGLYRFPIYPEQDTHSWIVAWLEADAFVKLFPLNSLVKGRDNVKRRVSQEGRIYC
jgi:hypothetical protein